MTTTESAENTCSDLSWYIHGTDDLTDPGDPTESAVGLSSLAYHRRRAMRLKRMFRSLYADNLARLFPHVERLGGGAFALVYSHPSDKTKAIKIGTLDDGWLFWAQYCRNHQGEPHIPTIHRIKRHQRWGIYVAVVERLAVTIDAAIWQRNHGDRAFCEPDWTHHLPAMAELPHWIHSTAARAYRRGGERFWPDLDRVLRTIRAIAKSLDLSVDLHGYNAMLADDGRLVITDPFSWHQHGNLDTRMLQLEDYFEDHFDPAEPAEPAA